MTTHLNLLAEQAEEALARADGFHDQRHALADQMAEVQPGAVRSFLARLARRRSA